MTPQQKFPEVLVAYEQIMRTLVPGVVLTFSWFEEGDPNHVQAGVFNVPEIRIEEIESLAYSLGEAFGQGRDLMITPIVRDIETTRKYYPAIAATAKGPSADPDQGDESSRWIAQQAVDAPSEGLCGFLTSPSRSALDPSDSENWCSNQELALAA